MLELCGGELPTEHRDVYMRFLCCCVLLRFGGTFCCYWKLRGRPVFRDYRHDCFDVLKLRRGPVRIDNREQLVRRLPCWPIRNVNRVDRL